MSIFVIRSVRAFALTLLLLLGLGFAGSPVLAADGGDLSGVVNVNTATAEQLMLLPGIGEAKARAILGRRKEQGAFKGVDELLEVKGIGAAALDRIRPFVTTQGKTSLSRK
jgi:competence ComEA-like helix-hairpin-helix protein